MRMLQEIEPHQFHNEFYHRELKDTDYYAYVKDGQIAVVKDGDKLTLPSVKDLGIKKSRFLFCIDDIGIYELQEDYEASNYYRYKSSDTFIESWMTFASIEAIRLVTWYRQNRYCGCCATELVESEKERAMVCPKCGNAIYPRINPVAIVGIVNDGKLLLTRYANHSRAWHYALIAGFCEFGETVEQTVKREVKEEVGLNVKDIKYVVSQSWPMSQSLIFGFYAKLDGDDRITFSDNELDKAVWQSQDEIEYIEAPSLTAYLINNFKKHGMDVFNK